MSRLGALATLLNGQLHGDPDREISGIASPGRATHDQIAVVLPGATGGWESHAAALVVSPGDPNTTMGRITIVVAEPRAALAVLVAHFHPEPPRPFGVEVGATVAPSARVAADAWIAAGARLDDGAVVGARTQVHAHVVIGRGCVVGDDCELYPHVVLYPGVTLGSRVVVHASSVLGRPGFGMHRGPDRWERIPQVGTVVVEDDVEIGVHCAVDRATLDETRIGRGAKIDNFVQIGHNTRIGENVLVVAQAGISGSVQVGANSILLGQVGVADHAVLAAGTTVGAGSGVVGRIGPGEWLGYPALPAARARRVYGILARLPELRRDLSQVRAQLARLVELLGPGAAPFGGSTRDLDVPTTPNNGEPDS